LQQAVGHRRTGYFPRSPRGIRPCKTEPSSARTVPNGRLERPADSRWISTPRESKPSPISMRRCHCRLPNLRYHSCGGKPADA
jgi:hypothetical protein